MSHSDQIDNDGSKSGSSLGFDLNPDAWLERVRAAQRAVPPGRHGPYELLGDIGRGGQGMVYKALQPKTQRIIAIKRLAAGIFSTSEMRARFEREIEAAAALEHPNIVTIFGSEIIDGQPTLLMQWIDGLPFDRWANPAGAPRRTVGEVLRAFAIVCDAIQHAHQRGVIHRDLKPSNILVDSNDQPHVLDFGLAKLSPSDRAVQEMTHTGAFLGTPAYASPEQLRGDPRGVDVRTDVYSLGTLLYQALTGQPMFDASRGAAHLMRDIEAGAAPRPSELDSRLNREIDAIVLRAAAADVDRRYPSVESLAADVRRFLAGDAVLAHPPSRIYKIRKLARQHLGLVVGWALFMISLTAATLISITLYLHAQRMSRDSDIARRAEVDARAKAEREEAAARHEAARYVAVSGFLQEMLHFSDPAWYPGKAGLTMGEALNQASAKIEKENNKYEPEVEAAVRMYVAISYVDLAQFAQAEPHVRRALDLRLKVLGEDHPDTAATLHYHGRILRNLGRLSEAEQVQRRVLAIRKRTLAPASPYIAQTECSLGILLRSQGKFDEAEEELTRAEAIYRQCFKENDDVANCMKNMAGVQLGRQCPAEAEDLLRRALIIFPRFVGPAHESIAGSVLQLAAARAAQNDPIEAEALTRAALAMMQGLYPAGHPLTAMIEEKLGGFLNESGRLDEAEAVLRDALSIRQRAFRDTFAEIPENMVQLADILRQQNRLNEAESCFRDAAALSKEYLLPGHRALSRAQRGLGEVYSAQNRFADAEPLFIAAIKDLDDPAPEAAIARQEAVAARDRMNARRKGAKQGTRH